MPVIGHCPENMPEHWPISATFLALGHIISPDGSIAACFDRTVKHAWRAFWANEGAQCLKPFSLELRLKRLQTFVFPVIAYRMTRWPYQLTAAKRLDALQRRMISIVLNVRMQAEETPDVFTRRRGRLAARYQLRMGSWSGLWAQAVVSWDAHLKRPTNCTSWASKVLHIRSPAELAERRADTGRPQCRALAGWVCTRWHESVHRAASELKCNRGVAPLRSLL